MTRPGPPRVQGKRRRRGFIAGTLLHLAQAAGRVHTAERLARAPGLLQSLDPRVKVVGLLSLVVAAALATSLAVLLGLIALGAVLAILSGIRLWGLARRLWLRLSIFTGPLALPAIFLTPGAILYRLPVVDWPVTREGLRGATFLVLRAESAATFALLLVLCTPWPHLLKALRVLRLPAVVVVLLSITQRYLFLLLEEARRMCEARQSRTVGTLARADERRWALASMGVLFAKTFELSGEVHLAMQARGFRGEVQALDEFQARPRDGVLLVGMLATAVVSIWI